MSEYPLVCGPVERMPMSLIPGAQIGAGQDALAVDRADDRSGHVELPRQVDPRHLGRLAADQRAARLAAGLGRAGDDRGGDLRAHGGGGEVIEEEQRPRALDQDVVDAVVDDVFAQRIHNARPGRPARPWFRRRRWNQPAPARASRAGARPRRTARRMRRSRPALPARRWISPRRSSSPPRGISRPCRRRPRRNRNLSIRRVERRA